MSELIQHFPASADGVSIRCQVSGQGETALLFVHGWLGRADWWEAQRAFFARRHTVIQMELAGHGQSGRNRQAYTAAAYAEDILAAAGCAGYSRLVLVAHSMGGAYALEAAPRMKKLAAVVLADTVKDLGNPMPPAQIDAILKLYREDFQHAVEEVLPQYLFSPATPPELKARLQGEFLANPGEFATKVIEPLYRMDLQAAAKKVAVPVRGISSDLTPGSVENNRSYFKDYDAVVIPATGHYLMLEKPAEFNAALAKILSQLGLSKEPS